MPEVLTCPQCGRRYEAPTTQCSFDGSALYGPKAAGRVGQTIGNYLLDQIVGVGGMGVVYKGAHVILEKPVAVKVLSDKFAARDGGIEQFLREAKAATRVRHPNIVDVTDFGTSPDGSVYFVMEWLEGISLEDVLARDGTVNLFNAVNIVRQIAHALGAAHEAGIVHRDLKPENIYLVNRPGRRRIVRRVDEGDQRRYVVEKEGNFDYVKLIDFGVAKYTAEDVGPGLSTRAGMLFGTPQYMSPEQARGEEVDGRSDIYALGVVFYEMVTGFVPFDGESALDILNGHVSGTLVPPMDRNATVWVDEGTDRTIIGCLEKDREQRYQTMDELIDALTHCFTDQVFLRDAHVMPGALEAGIIPPGIPQRKERSITDDLADLFKRGVGAGTGPADAVVTEAPDAVVELKVRSPSSMVPSVEEVATPEQTDLSPREEEPTEPEEERRETHSYGAVRPETEEDAPRTTQRGLGVVTDDPSSDPAPKRKKRITSPLGSTDDK